MSLPTLLEEQLVSASLPAAMLLRNERDYSNVDWVDLRTETLAPLTIPPDVPVVIPDPDSDSGSESDQDPDPDQRLVDIDMTPITLLNGNTSSVRQLHSQPNCCRKPYLYPYGRFSRLCLHKCS